VEVPVPVKDRVVEPLLITSKGRELFLLQWQEESIGARSKSSEAEFMFGCERRDDGGHYCSETARFLSAPLEYLHDPTQATA